MFDPVEYINGPQWQESRLGLERIRELLDRLDRPQDNLKFVHVAGTNGKGSVCTFLSSMLQAAGYRTGLFTSPYIEAFEERIRVDGENISAEDLLASTLAVREQAEAMDDHPTEFELMCAVALVHFVHSGCDIVVLEVGLGGRFDATNVIDKPEVCVIARIGLDHTKLLGNTLAAIAGEKAGIIKQSVPVVSWPQEPEAMDVIERVATQMNTSVLIADFSQLEAMPLAIDETTGESLSIHKRTFSYKEFDGLQTMLLGSYQPANAALAIEGVYALRKLGWNVPNEAVRAGIDSARWPGRFEIVAQNPLFIIDGGHNPQGACALVESLEDAFPGQKVVFVVGVLEDKNYPEMLETILPFGSAFVTMEPDSQRALSADKLARAIRWTGQDLMGCSACVKPYIARTADNAVAHACELAGPNGIVVAFGSLYSVAALKRALIN